MNLAKALLSISGFTLLSRILGLVRDTLIAQTFGVTKATEAFWMAFRIPNLLRRIFAEGAFSQAFVPILSDYKNKESKEASIEFTRKVAGLLSLVLFIITFIGVIAAPLIIFTIAHGFTYDAEKFWLATDFLKIVFPYIFFISLTSFCSAILNTYHQFAIPAITPMFLNIVLIIFTVWLSPYFSEPVAALAWGVFFAGLAQLLFQLPAIARLDFLRWPKFSFRDAQIKKVVQAMGIIIVGVSAGQISFLINSFYASYMLEGSVNWQYYSDRLMELPAGLLGVALGTILLPTLAKFAARGEADAYADLLDWGLRLAFILAIPAAVGLAVLALPLVATLFGYSKFTPYDVEMTRQAVIAYSLAVPGFIFVKILAPGFNSKQEYGIPVKIGFFILFFTQFLNLFFVLYAGLGIVGLNLSVGLAALMNSFILYYLLRRKNYYQPRPGWPLFLTKILIASVSMGLILYALLTQDYYVLDWQAPAKLRIAQLMILISVGVASYFGILFFLGFRKKDFIKWV